jgi:hypothetical protein
LGRALEDDSVWRKTRRVSGVGTKELSLESKDQGKNEVREYKAVEEQDECQCIRRALVGGKRHRATKRAVDRNVVIVPPPQQ